VGAFNAITTRGFDLLLWPFAGHPWAEVVVVSLLTAGVLLLAFRFASNQRAIRAAKDRLVSHLLEVFLYRNEVRVVLRAQGRLLRDSLAYLGQTLVPLPLLLPAMLLLFVQTDLRHGHRPLRVGERTLLAVKLHTDASLLDRVSIAAPPEVAVETPALRIPSTREVDWRLRAAAAGRYRIGLRVEGKTVFKQIVVDERRGPISSRRVRRGLWRQLVNPGEAPLPPDVPIEQITVLYPADSLKLFGWRLPWVWPWLLISTALGHLLKGLFRVQI
jgi:hypothetical protein